MFRSPALKFVVPTVLLLVAAIHLLPLLGIVGPAQLQRLYGVPIQDPVLELLLRHRALLFGLLGGGLVLAAFKPAWHGAALVAASVSVAGFLVLAWSLPGSVSPAITTVVRVDLVALVLLVVAAAVHLGPRSPK
ncbi:MAG: phosphopantetheine adenylyltransferase [Rubrivivax sp.]|nr:phosphopantetheine adenylyltransferase [Rubrivivax sp.]